MSHKVPNDKSISRKRKLEESTHNRNVGSRKMESPITASSVQTFESFQFGRGRPPLTTVQVLSILSPLTKDSFEFE